MWPLFLFQMLGGRNHGRHEERVWRAQGQHQDGERRLPQRVRRARGDRRGPQQVGHLKLKSRKKIPDQHRATSQPFILFILMSSVAFLKWQNCGFQDARGQEPATAGGQDGTRWSRQRRQGHRHWFRWPGLRRGHWTSVPGQFQAPAKYTGMHCWYSPTLLAMPN